MSKKPAASGKGTEGTPLLKGKQAAGARAAASSKHLPLLTYEESLKEVPWQTDNAHIRKGYRRHLGTVGLCLWSSIGCTSLFARGKLGAD